MSTTNPAVSPELLRAIGAAHITLGQHYHQLAETGGNYWENLAAAHQATKAAAAGQPPAPPAPVAANVAPPPPAPPAFPTPPAPPAAPGAAAAPAAPPADAKPPRVRRTKQQIADDEAAIKAGYANHADMVAKTGGAGAVASVSAPPVAPGATQVPQVPAVQQPPVPPAPPAVTTPPAPPAPPTDKGLEDLIATVQSMMGVITAAGWVGHEEGQAGLLLQRLGHQTLAAVPVEQRDNVAQWFNYFKSEFTAGNAPGGVSAWNPAGLAPLAA